MTVKEKRGAEIPLSLPLPLCLQLLSLHKFPVWAAIGPCSFLRNPVQLGNLAALLLSSPRGDQLRTTWWQNQFVTSLLFTFSFPGCSGKTHPRIWERGGSKKALSKLRKETGDFKLRANQSRCCSCCCNELARRTKLAASRFLAHAALRTH